MSNRTIYKYTLPDPDAARRSRTLTIPADAVPLTVQIQHNYPVLWMLVDDQREPEEITVHLIQTGERTPDLDQMTYVGTLQFNGGYYVLHVFIENHRPPVHRLRPGD